MLRKSERVIFWETYRGIIVIDNITFGPLGHLIDVWDVFDYNEVF